MNALPGGMLGGTSVLEPVLYDEERSVTSTFDTEVACAAGPELLGFVRKSQTRTLRGGVRGLNRQTDVREGESARLLQGSAGGDVVTLSRGSRPEGAKERDRTAVLPECVGHHRGPTDRGLMAVTGFLHGGGV
jgi:hypothetical protein